MRSELRLDLPDDTTVSALLDRPDRPPVARATVRTAVARALEEAGGLDGVPVFAGGKSFGGRMTSQAASETPLPGVRGLVFLGFPLHAAGKPGSDRAAHLTGVEVPMLFCDHSFRVLKRSGRTEAEVMAEIGDAVAAFVTRD